MNVCEVKVHLIGCWQNLGASVSGSGLNLVVAVLRDTVCVSCHCCLAWQTVVYCIPGVRLSGLS